MSERRRILASRGARALGQAGALLSLGVLSTCGLDKGGTAPSREWVTSLAPGLACAGDGVVAVWDEHIRCTPGAYGSGIGGEGAAAAFRERCPPYPQVTISDDRSPATVYVDHSRVERGSTPVNVDATTRVFFNADPVLYSSPGTGGALIALPRHIHSVEVIPPDSPRVLGAMADGVCTGDRPGWTDAVIDVRPGDVRSTTTRAVRVCNRSSTAANFTLATKDGRTLPLTIGPGSCADLRDFWPAELAEVSSRGGLSVAGADCSPTRAIPPLPIVFDVTLACPPKP